MKLCMDALVLQQILQAMKQVRAARDETLRLHLLATEGHITIEAQAPGMNCTVRWETPCEGHADVLFDYDRLVEAMKRVGKRKEWELTYGEDGFVVSGEQVLTFASDPFLAAPPVPCVGDRLPFQEPVKSRQRKTSGAAKRTQEAVYEVEAVDVVSVDIDQAELAHAVKLAAACAASPEMTKIPLYFQSLCVDVTENVLTILGSDRYRIGLQRMKVQNVGSWPVRLCIPAIPLLRAVHGMPVDPSRKLTVHLSAPVLRWKAALRNGKPLRSPEKIRQPTVPSVSLEVGGSSLTYSIATQVHAWPAYGQAIQQEQIITTVMLTKKQLQHAVNAFKDIAEVCNGACDIRLEGDKLTLAMHVGDEEATRSFKVSVDGDRSSRTWIMNIAYLVDALSQARCEEISWHLGSPDQPVTVTPCTYTRDAYHRIMPMYLAHEPVQGS